MVDESFKCIPLLLLTEGKLLVFTVTLKMSQSSDDLQAEVRDDIQAEVLQWLRLVREDVLEAFCDEFKINIPQDKRGNKSFIVKLLIKYLHSDALEALEDEGHSVFLKMHNDLERAIPGLGDKEDVIDPIVETGAVKSERETSGGKVNSEFSKKENFVNPDKRYLKIREFKINGVIGPIGQKDSLSYASLAFQIQRGKEEGYSFREIQSAVIRAIKHGNNLRDYLESRINIDENAFLQIIRSHFKEKDSSLVFHDMSNAMQLSSESEMDFCLRVMSLRERVITLSAEEGVPFNVNLLRKRFFLTLFTGFKSDTIRLELQSVLKNETISDEDLLYEVSLVHSAEQERSIKLKSKVSVNEVKSERLDSSDKPGKTTKEDSSKKEKESPLLLEIKKLTAKVSELSSVREEVQDLKKQLNSVSNNESNFKPRRFRGFFRCAGCERTNNSFCNHCFSCGASDHKKDDCPKNK